MEQVSRRDFVIGATAAALGAAAASGIGAQDAQAELVVPEEAYELELPTPDKSDDLLNQLLDESEVTSDLTLPDGRVIKAVYVRLRNRLNRIGRGVGSNVTETSWDYCEYLYTEEDAEHILEMPMYKFFSPYDYHCVSDHTTEECKEICEDLSQRGLMWHVNRAGTDFYQIAPHLNGVFEMCELDRYYHGTKGELEDFLTVAVNVLSPDFPKNQFCGSLPLLHSYPIGTDVIAEDEFAPYMDWSAIIEKNPTICRAPCQCRLMWKTIGENECDHPLKTCLLFNETAQHFLDLGLGEQLTQEEAMASMENAIDSGLIPTSVSHQDSDIICCCSGDCCIHLRAFKSINGEGEAWKNYNAYVLDYDKDTCIQCGACAEACPMEAISFDDDGYCIHSQLCVRCGHCVRVCPADARILKYRGDYPTLPKDYTDLQIYFAKDRLQHGYLYDFTDSTLDNVQSDSQYDTSIGA